MAARSFKPRLHAATTTSTNPGASVDVHGTNKRDWANLFPDIVRTIADKLLGIDVTEYICLRAVCKPWRTSTDDPSLLQPRFFPRNWLMLRDDEDEDEYVGSEDEDVVVEEEDSEDKALPEEVLEHRFVNVVTGATLRIRLPPVEQYGHVLLTDAAEGLLVLHCRRTDTVRLFNPLTMATAAVLPGLADAPKAADSLVFTSAGVMFDGEPPERPTVVLIVAGLCSARILYAKPGDNHWGTVDTGAIEVGNGEVRPFERGLSLHGRFYVATRHGEVLKVELAPQPHLVYVAVPNGPRCTCGMAMTSYLVPSLDDDRDDNDGMLLLHCYRMEEVDAFGVHLGNGSLTPLLALRNRTVFLPSTTLCTDNFPLLHGGPGQVYLNENVGNHI